MTYSYNTRAGGAAPDAGVAAPFGRTFGAVQEPTVTFATLLEPLGLKHEYDEAFIKSGIPIQVCCCTRIK